MTVAKVVSGFGNQWSGGATSTALAYTTTAVDQNIILEISTENASGSFPVLSSVTDTNSLTWAKRGSTQTGTASNGAQQATEIWWAHAPTAVSGTITVTMTAAIDDGALAGIVLQGALTPSSPWDANGSLPATFSDVTGTSVTPSATISTTNANTLVMAFQSSPQGSSQTVVAGTLTLNHSEYNHGGSDWENAFLASEFFNSAQTSKAITLGSSQPNQFLIVDAIAVVGPPASGEVAVDTTLKNQFSLSTSTATTGALTTSQTPCVLVMGICLADTAGPDVTSVTDTYGLTWARRARVTNNDAGGGHQILDEWWALAPNGVVSDTITIHYTAQPVTAVYTIIAVSGVTTPSSPFDGNVSLPATADNTAATGGASSVPAVTGVSVTAHPSLILVWQDTRQATTLAPPSGFTDVGAENWEPGAGDDRAYMDASYFQESSAVSSATYTSTSGSISPWGMIVDAIVGGPAAPTATWASTETPDSAAITVIGYPGVVADLAAIEILDVLAAVGFTASVGTMIVQETPDNFAARVIRPTTGTLAVTEQPDTFVAAGVGFGVNISMDITELLDIAHFLVDAVQPTNGVLAATETPDRFQALGAGAVAPSSQQTVIFFVA